MKNKILILSSVLCLGIIISYVAFGWSEPTGSMPSEYKIPINTSIESQDVTEGKPVVANLDADKVDGYEASDLLAATTAASGGSTLNLIVAQYAKNNSGLDFPGCPTGFVPLLQDGFVQYQNQENVLGGYYDATYFHYRPRISLNGVDMPITISVLKNTQNASCYKATGQYISSSSTALPFTLTCVGDCSSCSDAANIAVTYTICARNPLSATIQGGTVSAPSISTLTVNRLISDVPYKGKLQVIGSIDNGGENVVAEIYDNDVLIDTKTVTTTYPTTIYEVSESITHNLKLKITNSGGSDEETIVTWVGAIGGGMHTEADCRNAGGEPVSIQPGQRTCRFTQNSWFCPSEWTGYYNWSTTTNNGGSSRDGTGCDTGFHAWANLPQETCYYYNRDTYPMRYDFAAIITQRGCY